MADRRKPISDVDFFRIYLPLAKADKSALEIARALGHDGDEAKASQFVSIKAGNLRKRLAAEAEAKAVELKLDAKATSELVDAARAKVPKLKRHGAGRAARNVTSALDELLAEMSKSTPSE